MEHRCLMRNPNGQRRFLIFVGPTAFNIFTPKTKKHLLYICSMC
jgi:hypothetical protein